MEDTTISNPSMMEPLLFPVDDPMSLLLSQNYSDNNNNNNLCEFVRGPRYGEYATLRESKLRLKREYETILKEEEERFFGGGGEKNKNNQTRFGFTREDEIRVSPEKKTRFGFKYNPNPRRMSSSSSCSLAQSVPDFSSMIRKENRRPANSNLLPRRTDLTPPPSKSGRNGAVFGSVSSSVRGSMSAGDKKRTVRKSYATVEDLKKVSMAAASGINGGGGGGGRKSIGGGGGRTILGYRQIY